MDLSYNINPTEGLWNKNLKYLIEYGVLNAYI